MTEYKWYDWSVPCPNCGYETDDLNVAGIEDGCVKLIECKECGVMIEVIGCQVMQYAICSFAVGLPSLDNPQNDIEGGE